MRDASEIERAVSAFRAVPEWRPDRGGDCAFVDPAKAPVSHSVGASIGTAIVTLTCVLALWKGLVEEEGDYRAER